MITINGLKVETFQFPGGERHPRLPTGLKTGPMSIVAYLQDSNSFMDLHLVLAAIRSHFAYVKIHITIPYLPYARQDRVANWGEAHSSEVFLRLLPSGCKYTFIDIHNPEVLSGMLVHYKDFDLLSVAKVIDQHHEKLSLFNSKDVVLVAPDAGATKKVKLLAKHYCLDWIQGTKERDCKTGKLSGFSYNTRGVTTIDKHLLIVDDICDGGGTFLGLGTALKLTGYKSLSLYVTHGIFSKGTEGLKSLFNKIYTTDTWSNKFSCDVETLEIVKYV